MKKKLLKKSEKNYKYFKYFNNILLRLTQRASKLQEKTPALQREHPAFQKFLHFSIPVLLLCIRIFRARIPKIDLKFRRL
jgi:hypothetical protein